MRGLMLLFHIIGATIWTGGHLVLALAILPNAMKERSVTRLQWFESRYELIGIPALVIQVITGLWLSAKFVPDSSFIFMFDNPAISLIWIKLGLLLITVLLAADARLRIIPKLSEDRLIALFWHIIPVTIISVLYVIIGVSFRTGWFF